MSLLVFGSGLNSQAADNAGSVDPTFHSGNGFNGAVEAVAVQSDGKIIMGGQFTTYNATGVIRLARLNTEGSLDTTFTVGSGADSIVYAVAIQSDGKIIMAGYFTSVDTYTRDYIARLLGDIPKTTTVTNLTSSPNPSVFGQSVSFMASITPITATGTVTFTEGATVLGTAPVISGTAVYTTANLVVGSHVITATYSGDSTYAGAVSQQVTQVVQAACSPLLVTAVTDDGSGTLSYALSQPITGSNPVTITFALTGGNTITFTGSLTTTAKVKAHVTIYGGAFGSTSRIILNGNGVAGDGLHLAGNNYLVNLTIEHFGGRELVLEGTGNRMQGVVVIAS